MSERNDNSQLEMIIGLMQEQKKDIKSFNDSNQDEFKALRQSNHDMRDELARVVGLFNIVKVNADNEKEKNERELLAINERMAENKEATKAMEEKISKEIDALEKKMTKELEPLKKSEPKVDRLYTTYLWVARAFVLGICAAVITLIMKVK